MNASADHTVNLGEGPSFVSPDRATRHADTRKNLGEREGFVPEAAGAAKRLKPTRSDD